MPAVREDTYSPRRQRRSAQLSLRGATHYVSLWGDENATPIVYLHGWGDTGSTFQFVVDALSQELPILALDWRGFGRSAHVGSSYWFPDYLADLDALLNVYTPEAPAILVGHSMGGNVAGLYAGIRPERVKAFVNVEGFGLPDGDADGAPLRYRRWIERLSDDSAYSTYATFSELAARIQHRNPRIPGTHARFVAREWAAKDARGVVRLRADPRHRLPNPVTYRRAEAAACWRRITADIVIVAGAHSAIAEDAAGWLDAAGLPADRAGRATRIVADAGHMVHFEAPERLAAVIEETFAACQ